MSKRKWSLIGRACVRSGWQHLLFPDCNCIMNSLSTYFWLLDNNTMSVGHLLVLSALKVNFCEDFIFMFLTRPNCKILPHHSEWCQMVTINIEAGKPTPLFTFTLGWGIIRCTWTFKLELKFRSNTITVQLLTPNPRMWHCVYAVYTKVQCLVDTKGGLKWSFFASVH